MTEDEAKIGVRVRLTRDICGGSYPGAMIAEIKAGETAEVVDLNRGADITSGEGPITVFFDAHLPALDDWNNTLHVGIDRSIMDWDTTIDDWEVVRGFG